MKLLFVLIIIWFSAVVTVEAQYVQWERNINMDAGVTNGLGSYNLMMLHTANDELVVCGPFTGSMKFLRYDTLGTLLDKVDDYLTVLDSNIRQVIYLREEPNGNIVSVLDSGEIAISNGDGNNSRLISFIDGASGQVLYGYNFLAEHDSLIYVSSHSHLYELNATNFTINEVSTIEEYSTDSYVLVKRVYMADDSYFNLYRNTSNQNRLLQYIGVDNVVIWEKVLGCDESIYDIDIFEDRIFVSGIHCNSDSTAVIDVLSEIDIAGDVIWETTTDNANNIKITDDAIYVYGGEEAGLLSYGSLSKLTLDGDLIWGPDYLNVLVRQVLVIGDTPYCITEYSTDYLPYVSYLLNYGGLVSSASTLSIFDVEIYPNPSSGYIFIEHDKITGVRCQLYDAVGRVVYVTDDVQYESSYVLDVSNFDPGIYYLHVYLSDTDDCHVEKLIID